MRGCLPLLLACSAGLACAEARESVGSPGGSTEQAAPPPLALLPSLDTGPRDPVAAERWFAEGHAAASSGNHPQAVEAFKKAIDADPSQGLAYLEAAESLLIVDGDLALTRAMLERAVQLLPDNPRAHLRLGGAALAGGDDLLAERELRSAIRIRTDLAEARVFLAAMLERQGKPKLAEDELLLAIKSEPGNVQARVRLAELFSAQGKNRDAAQQVEAAARAVQRSADLYRRAARFYEVAGDKKAMAEMKLAADLLDPPAKSRKLRPLPAARVAGSGGKKKISP